MGGAMLAAVACGEYASVINNQQRIFLTLAAFLQHFGTEACFIAVMTCQLGNFICSGSFTRCDNQTRMRIFFTDSLKGFKQQLRFQDYFLLLFGWGGKTGINCFVLITGYFMCTSSVKKEKFLKLLGERYFYTVILWNIFFFTGYEPFSLKAFLKMLFPFFIKAITLPQNAPHGISIR